MQPSRPRFLWQMLMMTTPTWSRRVLSLHAFLLPIGALVIWWVCLPSIDVRRVNDVGLVSVLPPLFYAAVLLLTGSFCLVLRQWPVRVPTLLLHVVVLIALLYGTPVLVEELPRFASSWKHMGIVDYIQDHGHINPRIDAYFNWPGFFALAAFLAEVAGLDNLFGLAKWAPVYFNVLFLGPLLILLRAVTSDRRLVWVGVWIFYLLNWVGQDYFAPQAFAYLLYLTVLAVIVRWFRTPTALPRGVTSLIERLRPRAPWLGLLAEHPERREERAIPSTPRQRVGVMAIVIAVSAALVASHQLTPVAALIGLGALVVFDRITPRSLPVLLGVMIASWISFLAVTYFAGHVGGHLQQVGAVEQNVERVAQRLSGSPGHLFVVRMRVVMAVVAASLGVAGGLRRLQHGYRDLTLALLVVAPAFLVALQAHGGEIGLRSYYYALPPLAFFVAALLVTPSAGRAHWHTSAAVGLTSIVLCGGFLIARYGNERMEYFTPKEVAGVQYLLATAPQGSVLVAPITDLPWKFEDYSEYRYEGLEPDPMRDADAEAVAEQLANLEREHGRPAYLLITRSSKAGVELFLGFEPGAVDRLEHALRASDKFRVIFSNPDATIMVLSEPDADGVSGTPR